MAVVLKRQTWVAKRVARIEWGPMLTTDVGVPESPSMLSDRSVQVTGTFGVGGGINIQGSNDGGVTWFNLKDPSNTVIALTAAGGAEILENTQMVRPSVIAGDGTTSLTVSLVCASTA